MKDSEPSEALRTIQAQVDQALKAKNAKIDGKLAKMSDALKQHSQALELLQRQSKGIAQDTIVSSTEKSTDFQSTFREQSQALTELDAQCETLINDRTTASTARDTPSDYNIFEEGELVDEQRRTIAELRRDAEKALTAARRLVQAALEPANITQTFPRETALTLANAETWFQKKSSQITGYQTFLVERHQEWTAASQHFLANVWSEFGLKPDWPQDAGDIRGWWKDRMDEFLVARQEERQEHGKLVERFKELTAERAELLKLVEKRGELLT
jgi:HD-GYP domain-containing protein (c-di-GMP phosphodiesterase class II)